jgi:hypothetical protein
LPLVARLPLIVRHSVNMLRGLFVSHRIQSCSRISYHTLAFIHQSSRFKHHPPSWCVVCVAASELIRDCSGTYRYYRLVPIPVARYFAHFKVPSFLVTMTPNDLETGISHCEKNLLAERKVVGGMIRSGIDLFIFGNLGLFLSQQPPVRQSLCRKTACALVV